MTLRAGLRLLLLAAMLLAPLGRIGIAQAMAAPSASGMAMAHCAGMPAPAAGHHRQAPARGEKMAVDCMTACAALAALPAPAIAPPLPVRAAAPPPLPVAAPRGLHPDAELPPPRLS